MPSGTSYGFAAFTGAAHTSNILPQRYLALYRPLFYYTCYMNAQGRAVPGSVAADSAALVDLIRSLRQEITVRPTERNRTLMPISGIGAVLFDVYGTMFISGSGDISVARESGDESHFHTVLRHLAPVNASHSALEVAARRARAAYFGQIEELHESSRAAGISYPEVDIVAVWGAVLDSLFGELLPGLRHDTDTARIAAVVYEGVSNPVSPAPGLFSMLRTLSHRGVHLGIVSNAQFYTPLLFPAFLETSLSGAGIDPELCSWSYQLREAKPSTRLFRPVLDTLKTRFNMKPAEVLYVGNDMLNDIWTARSCGCRTCLFAGDERSLRLREKDVRCADLEPDAVITRLADLPGILPSR